MGHYLSTVVLCQIYAFFPLFSFLLDITFSLAVLMEIIIGFVAIIFRHLLASSKHIENLLTISALWGTKLTHTFFEHLSRPNGQAKVAEFFLLFLSIC